MYLDVVCIRSEFYMLYNLQYDQTSVFQVEIQTDLNEILDLIFTKIEIHFARKEAKKPQIPSFTKTSTAP